MSARTPTSEQAAIIAAAGANDGRSLRVNADAGTGKSTTLEMLAPSLRKGPIVALAFNKINAEEMQRRLPSHVEARTLNALGHRALALAIGGVRVNTSKLRDIVKDMKNVHFTERDEVYALAQSAMRAGLVPANFEGEHSQTIGLIEDTLENWQALAADSTPGLKTIEQASEALTLSIRAGLRGDISFDDQIYLSALFTPTSYPRFHTILVDESQDLSALNHRQLSLMGAKRFIVVGDRKQAIYAWRGADADSMDSMLSLAGEWVDLPLHVTFRCPKLIVARQQEHAPGYQAHDSNAEGSVVTLAGEAGWEWRDIETLRENATRERVGTRVPELAILCRNNAPLIALALKLLAQDIPARVLGRDIGMGLTVLSRKIARDDCTPQNALIEKINAWAARESELALANGAEGKLDNIYDRADALRAIAANVRDAGELRARLNMLFSDTNEKFRVLLSTIHKAKGREWDCVVHLDPHRCPSKWARSESAKEQERNLKYVCETRTKHTLAMARMEDFK